MRTALGIAVLTILAAGGSAAQNPTHRDGEAPILRFAGEPLALPFDCAGQGPIAFETRCTAAKPCPIYLEITSVEAIREKVFVAGNFHDGGSTLVSFLLRSEDGGQSWQEVHERLRGVRIDLVHFHDEDTGWATGHVLSVPPRDPFFLITTDGGRHWRRRNVLSESGTGVIEKLWFQDVQSGGLLIDRVHAGEAGGRYERYETMTGGANWMIREVSATPIRVRNVVAVEPDPDWRFTPDKDRGAWRVEQRQPGGWATVAEFLMETALCQPAPEVAASPTEELPAATDTFVTSAEGELPVAPGGVLVIGRPGRRSRPPEPSPPAPGPTAPR